MLSVENRLQQPGEEEGDTLSVLYRALSDLVDTLEKINREVYSTNYSLSFEIISQIRELMMLLEPMCEPLPSVQAMRNDIILEEVLKRSSTSDLLNFRLVNKCWNALSMKILTRRESLKITINRDSLSWLQLAALNEGLEGSKRLPINHLNLQLIDEYTEIPYLLDFFKVHGPHIRSLTLNGGSTFSPQKFVKNLFSLLTKHFPHVENLAIGSNFKAPGLFGHELLFDPEIGQEPFVLRSIKSLCFEWWKIPEDYLMTILIRAAVNLEDVLGSFESVVMSLVSTNRIELLKSYNLDATFLDELFPLAMARPKLKDLVVNIRRNPFVWDRILEPPLEQILESSRDTLVYFCIHAYHVISATNITCLPNLNWLHLSNRVKPKWCIVEPRKPIFPERIVLAETFPRLKNLVLQLDNVDKEALEIFFPGDNFKHPGGHVDILSTVENLVLDCRLTRFGLKALARKFPNVSNIRAINYKEFFLNEESVWCVPWTCVEVMELGGFAFGDLFWKRSLDSFFTGFSDSICKNLRGIVEMDDLLFNLDVIAFYPSVRNLKNLKRLGIAFDGIRNRDWSLTGRENCGGISRLVGLYAFNKMPNLHQVVFSYDHKLVNSAEMAAVLKPILAFPMVTVNHVELDLFE